MATTNWRTINIDALDPDSPANFDLTTLAPATISVTTADIQSNANQIRQLLRGGDSEGALRSALENVPYGGDEKGKELHAALVVEILQSIRQSEMTPLLTRIFESEGGTELLDVLMKYLNKGMALPPAQPSGTNSVNAGSRNLTPQGTGAGFSQISPRSFGGAGGGGGAGEGGGQAMSVLLSWHEKVVEIAGLGAVVRCMSDRRTV